MVQALIAASIFLIGCGSSGSLRSQAIVSLELELSFSPPVASVEDTITITHALVNAGNSPVTICRTENHSLAVGRLKWSTVTDHESCVPANRTTLEPGESVLWARSVSLGSCEDEPSFLRVYSICPGMHPVSAKQAVLVGEKCTSRSPCPRVVVTSLPAELLVE